MYVKEKTEILILQSPSVPVKDLVQEAEDLYQWALHDKDALLKAGIEAENIEQLRSLARTLCIAQGTWNSAHKSHSDARRNWIKAAPRAYGLRDKLVHEFLYAYRNEPDTLALVRKAAQGDSYADMIQDLMDLKHIGADHPAPLGKINFDFAQLDSAAAMAEAMGTLLAVANASSASATGAKATRDQAYTCLKSKMTEVREAGKYLFYRNIERKQGYRSDYYRLHNRRSLKLKAFANEPEQIAKAA